MTDYLRSTVATRPCTHLYKPSRQDRPKAVHNGGRQRSAKGGHQVSHTGSGQVRDNVCRQGRSKSRHQRGSELRAKAANLQGKKISR